MKHIFDAIESGKRRVALPIGTAPICKTCIHRKVRKCQKEKSAAPWTVIFSPDVSYSECSQKKSKFI